MKQHTIVTLADMKARGEKISQLTCYDYSTVCLLVLVGFFLFLLGVCFCLKMQG